MSVSGFDVNNRDASTLGEIDGLEARIADLSYCIDTIGRIKTKIPVVPQTSSTHEMLGGLLQILEGKHLSLRDALQRRRTPED